LPSMFWNSVSSLLFGTGGFFMPDMIRKRFLPKVSQWAGLYLKHPQVD
jgi:hypothetical protein